MGEDAELGLGIVPVDAEIRQQPLIGIGRALEVDAQLLAHDAVGAVAAGEIAAAHGLAGAVGQAQVRGHAVLVLGERGQRGAALDGDAEPGQVLGEHALGLALRHDEDVRILAVDGAVHRDVRDALAAAVHAQALGRVATGEERLDRAHGVEELHGAGVDAKGPGRLRRLGALVDDARPDAATGQLARQREAGGTGADDEDVVDIEIGRGVTGSGAERCAQRAGRRPGRWAGRRGGQGSLPLGMRVADPLGTLAARPRRAPSIAARQAAHCSADRSAGRTPPGL